MRRIAFITLTLLTLFFMTACGNYKWNNIFDLNNDLPDVTQPIFNPPGNTYTVAQYVSMTSATEGAVIFYTLDGSTPTQTSNPYSGPVFVPENMTIKAKAFKNGCNPSPVASGSYVITTPTCSNPLITPAGDTYSTPQNIVITCTTAGAEIRYTTDGSDPSQVTSLYVAPISVSGQTTIKARAYKEGITPSQIVAQVYNFVTASPIIYPPAGNYNNPQNISISCGTEGALIKYTTDGSEPTNASDPYIQPIYIDMEKTIKAKAYKSGYTPSATVTGHYTIDYIVSNPTFDPDPNVVYTIPQGITISSETQGASIYYTTDGSTPNQNSTLYTGVFDIDASTTIKAIASKSGWQNSQIVSASYQINLIVPQPAFDPPDGNYPGTTPITITCTMPGSIIRYTTNGSEPNINSNLYTAPVLINSDVILKAKAYKTGCSPSPTATAYYTIGLIYDFENSEGNFIPQGWVHGTPTQVTPHSGSELWALSLSDTYSFGAAYSLTTPKWILGDNAVFSFWHTYNFSWWAYNHSGFPANYHSHIGYVYLSNDNGVNWTQLTSSQGNTDYQWSMNWGKSTYDLSQYSHQNVSIKFYVFAQSEYDNVPRSGWFIDDVQITNATEIVKKKGKH
jgi:hypothetical protein